MEQAIRPRAIPLDWRLARADDTELVSACAANESEAFRELLTRYRRPAVTLAYQMLGNAEDAEDAAQEAFVRVFQSIPDFRGQAAFSTWLYRIVTNLCLGKMRRDRPSIALDSVAEPATADSPARRVTEGLLARDVLARMSPQLRAILLLRDQEELSYREISAALNLPLGTVRSRLSKARSAFRRIWNDMSESRED